MTDIGRQPRITRDRRAIERAHRREMRISDLTAERDALTEKIAQLQGSPGNRWLYGGLAAATALITAAIAFDVINKTTGNVDMYYVLGGMGIGLGLAVTAVFAGKAAAAARQLTARS